MAHVLRSHPLQAAEFAPYGQVLPLRGPAGLSINAGTSQRLDLVPGLNLLRENGQAALAVFQARAQAPQGPWHLPERHCLGSQTFIPLQGTPCLLLVALGADMPDPATFAAFTVEGIQGFTLHAGTWHHPLIALADGDFLVIERAGDAVDCEVQQLASPVLVQMP
jgi:ureidoglycolate lyase